MLIYTSSTTCFEALALGVPVIHVESDYIVDTDPLDFLPKIRMSARSPQDIRSRVEELESKDRKKRSAEKKEWKKAVREVFEPVTDETYYLFSEIKK